MGAKPTWSATRSISPAASSPSAPTTSAPINLRPCPTPADRSPWQTPGAVYTIDELLVDDAVIEDNDEGSYDNTFGDYGSSVSIDADQDYDLAIEAIGSMSEAGTDSVTNYSDGLEYSGSGSSDWQYDDFDDGDSVQASGSGSTESDVDVYGTYYSDADSGPDVSVTYDTDTYRDWNASATDTGNTVYFPVWIRSGTKQHQHLRVPGTPYA